GILGHATLPSVVIGSRYRLRVAPQALPRPDRNVGPTGSGTLLSRGGTLVCAGVRGRLWSAMTTRAFVVLGVFWAFVGCAAVAAEPAIGWRGDGTGRFPSADPPATWGRVSKSVKGLRCQARKPKDADRGTPMPDGVAREWLVLGPVPLPEGAKVERDTLPNEVQFAPDEGEKLSRLTWTKLTTDTAWVDFAKLFGMRPDSVAYACTHVYSETGAAVRLVMSYVGGARVSVNGKEVKPWWGVRATIDLVKGWNRILLKVPPGENDWFVVPLLHGWPPADYEETNIAWVTPLPDVKDGFYGGGMGVASPLAIGDRVYIHCEPCDLICIAKANGKVLWVRRHSYFEAAPAEDRKHPAWAQAEAVASKINAIAEGFVADGSYPDLLLRKAELEKDLEKELRRIDADRYARGEVPDIGFSGCTPTTDGAKVYVWSPCGVTACYDLDGNRKWIRVDRLPAVEHGFSSSPLLVDGKVVVFMRDLLAFDAATGSLAWRIPLVDHKGANPQGYFHGSPVAATVGGVKVIVLGNGTLVRASDGKVVFTTPGVGAQTIPSPIVERDTILQLTSGSMQLFIHKAPAAFAEPLKLQTTVMKVETPFPKHYMPWHIASPLLHEGLAYLLNNSGVLTVVDVQEAKILYQKLLDLDFFVDAGAARGIGISPALGGRNIYFFGTNGAALVVEPGRVYKQVAKNRLDNVVMNGHWAERQERFLANPIFDGKRLYLRGEANLYAIEQK
ncbi:MAG: PQQ-binding-like beta-propeller repeat protein, partial [Planctomycetota bacterium]|nr:PQQ-binding-like beta-propeller repeat protein [Planctomycetota bacterium]